MQRAWDRCRGHRQHIHGAAQPLEPFLDFHAEALFFVDDHESEVVESDVLRRQAVCADHDVDASGRKALDNVALFVRAAEPTEPRDVERKLRHPFAECVKVLFGQDRGRDQHRNLVAAVHGLERRAHGDFGLAKAHVAAEESIHGTRLVHVVFDGLDRRKLVDRFLVRKRRIEFLLPFRVLGKRDAGASLACRLDFQHFGGQVDHGGFGGGFLSHPGLAADARQGRATLGATHVFLDQADALRRHVDLRVRMKLDLQVLFHAAMLFDLPHPAIPTDAVREVYDQVSFAQFEEAVDRLAQSPARCASQFTTLKQLRAADQNQPLADQPEPFVQCADQQVQTPGLCKLCGREDLAQPLQFGLHLGDQVHIVVGGAAIEFLPHFRNVATEPLHRFDGQTARGAEPTWRDRGGGGQRELPQGPRDVVRADHALLRFQTREVAFRFRHRLVGLDQQHPGVGRQILGQQHRAAGLGAQHRDLNLGQRFDAALRI